MQRFLRFLVASLAAAAALSGCASGYLLDNQVQSFTRIAALPAEPTYRFDRLPSQQEAFPQQDSVEALADAALHRAGLRRDDTAPKYSVQVSARIDRVLSPYADPWDGWGGGWGLGFGGRRGSIGFGGPWGRMDSPWYHREVSVILRDLASQQVVYETRAANDGPLLDNKAVLPAMFDAAMQGFPNAPAGPRRVDVQLGGR
jgi:hypothetical protein